MRCAETRRNPVRLASVVTAAGRGSPGRPRRGTCGASAWSNSPSTSFCIAPPSSLASASTARLSLPRDRRARSTCELGDDDVVGRGLVDRRARLGVEQLGDERRRHRRVAAGAQQRRGGRDRELARGGGILEALAAIHLGDHRVGELSAAPAGAARPATASSPGRARRRAACGAAGETLVDMDEEIAVVAHLAERAGLAAVGRERGLAGSRCRRRQIGGLARLVRCRRCRRRWPSLSSARTSAPRRRSSRRRRCASSMWLATSAMRSAASVARDLLLELVLDLVEGLLLRRLDAGDAQDVPAERALDRLGGGALLQREGGVGELGRQVGALDPAEIERGGIARSSPRPWRRSAKFLPGGERALGLLRRGLVGQQHLLRPGAARACGIRPCGLVNS